jgi:hypothetical protein
LKQDKQFDCVRMKTEIQERLLREIAELGEEEAARRRRDRLAHDPFLGSVGKRCRTGLPTCTGETGRLAG